MKKNVLIILLSVFVLSCNSYDDNLGLTDVETNLMAKENLLGMTNIESTLIAKGNLFGDGHEGIIEQKLEITDQKSLNNLISKMNSVNNVSDSFSEIDIDFSQYKIIAIFDEIKGNGGHSLNLNITSNSKKIIVTITDIVPEGNVTTDMTQPFHIVKIKNSKLPIIFE